MQQEREAGTCHTDKIVGKGDETEGGMLIIKPRHTIAHT